MGQRVRVGVVGGGQIVEDTHLPVLAKHPDAVVVWLTDLDENRGALLSKMYGVDYLPPTEIPSLLGDVDACLLAIPIGARGPYLEACAAREVAVLSEKPFASSTKMHRELLDLFPPHRLGAGLQKRAFRTCHAMRDLIKTRVFGQLKHVEIIAGGFDLKSGGAGRYLNDATLAGGGVLMEIGVHELDQALVATEARSVSVTDAKGVLVDGMDFDVTVDAELQTAQGKVTLHSEFTRLRPIRQKTTLDFEHANISLAPSPGAPIYVEPNEKGHSYRLDISDVDGAVTMGQAFWAEWSTFLNGLLREREENWVSASTSLITTQFLEEIYEELRDDR